MKPRTRRPRPAPLALGGGIWVTAGGESLGGQARIALLRAIAEHGSITRAAHAVGLSYKAAWDNLEAMNRLAGEPLVERSAGGRGGGSTRLTPHGERIVERFEQIDAVHHRFLAVLNEGAFDLGTEFSLLKVVTMKTSARNQYVGTVTSVRSGAVNDEVEITVDGGPRIVAVITRASTLSLGLRTNMTAIALVKSSSVMVAAGLDGARLSARNQFTGVVSALTPGAVNAEVTIAIDGGGEVTAIVTQASVAALGLSVGGRATAFFKASSVIVAVPG
jgi:molybdate transport system regulatory protein